MPTLTPEPPLNHQKSQANNYHEDQDQHQEVPPSYNLQITPLLDPQRQLHKPCYPPSSPSTHLLRRQRLYIRLHTIYLDMKDAALATFYARIRCPRCGQLPIILDPPLPPTLPLSFMEKQRMSLLDMNHHLPSEALKLWKTIKKEMDGVDLLRLRQGHLDQVVKGLMKIERLFMESDVGGCGVEAWNGGMIEPPID